MPRDRPYPYHYRRATQHNTSEDKTHTSEPAQIERCGQN